MDARDGRFGESVERLQQAREAARVLDVLRTVVSRRLGHPAQVGAGAERLAAPAEHDDAHRGVGLEPPQRRAELVEQRGVQRVAQLGTREPDTGDARVDRAFDDLCSIRRGVVHGASWLTAVTCGTRRSASPGSVR